MKTELNRVMVSAMPPSWSQTLTTVGVGQGQMRNRWRVGKPVQGRASQGGLPGEGHLDRESFSTPRTQVEFQGNAEEKARRKDEPPGC